MPKWHDYRNKWIIHAPYELLKNNLEILAEKRVNSEIKSNLNFQLSTCFLNHVIVFILRIPIHFF